MILLVFLKDLSSANVKLQTTSIAIILYLVYFCLANLLIHNTLRAISSLNCGLVFKGYMCFLFSVIIIIINAMYNYQGISSMLPKTGF